MILSELPFLSKDIRFYIDAGSMTILVQFLIAFFIAGVAMIKVYWARIKPFFGFLRSKDKKDKSDDEPVK